MRKNFLDPSYLAAGNTRQRYAHKVLTELQLFGMLSEFHPTLTGTIPIGVDLPSSDLDIICECHNPSQFQSLIKEKYGEEQDFGYRNTKKQGMETQIANFHAQGIEIEIFGQPIPVTSQMAYRHMIKEYEILQTKDDGFRLEVIQLKKRGLSTEAAFAKLLSIEGDPYVGLMEY